MVTAISQISTPRSKTCFAVHSFHGTLRLVFHIPANDISTLCCPRVNMNAARPEHHESAVAQGGGEVCESGQDERPTQALGRGAWLPFSFDTSYRGLQQDFELLPH